MTFPVLPSLCTHQQTEAAGWLPKSGDKKAGDKDDLHTCDLSDTKHPPTPDHLLCSKRGEEKHHRD